MYLLNIFKIFGNKKIIPQKTKKINNENKSIESNSSTYDEDEIDRLHEQNYLLEYIFGDKFCAPLNEKILKNGKYNNKNVNILDSGCGPGTWIFSMAEKYPNVNFYGVDINKVYPDTIKPPNCIFKYSDITKNIEVNEVENFYYIKQTLLSNSLKFNDWEDVISRLINITSNNGWLEFVEVGLEVQKSGPKYQILNDAIINKMDKLGFRTNIAEELENILKKFKLKNVVSKTIPIYFKDKNKVVQEAWIKNIKTLHNNSKYWLEKELEYTLISNNISYEEYINECMEECQNPKYNPHYIWYCVYGEK